MSKVQTRTSLRALPSVDSLLRTETARSLRDQMGATRLSSLARQVTDELRREIMDEVVNEVTDLKATQTRSSLLQEAEKRLASTHLDETARSLRRVINATGVV